VQDYVALLKKLEKDYRVKQFFNTDLSHIQQYLFHRLKVEPTSKVKVQYEIPKLVEVKSEIETLVQWISVLCIF
jgi:hypothetical protein